MKKSCFIPILVSLFSIVVVMGVMELVFRIFPPTGVFYPGYQFDPYLGYRHLPFSQIIYNKANGLVKNMTNQEGWIDIDHREKKANLEFRVAFFGDSYVEGVTVPSEKHFYRILPQEILGYPLEYFGFGMSGFGTIHSYINSMRYLPSYDFDLILYVFVEKRHRR